jgi:hypothetical protein
MHRPDSGALCYDRRDNALADEPCEHDRYGNTAHNTPFMVLICGLDIFNDDNGAPTESQSKGTPV